MSKNKDSRMQGFYHDKAQQSALYRYDAGGEREMKLLAKVQDVNISGYDYKQPIFDYSTLYASPLMTINANRSTKGIIKHYFAGSERILANVAGSGTPLVPADTTLKTITQDNPVELSIDYTKFAEQYFVAINQTACNNNGIELPAETQSIKNMRMVYEGALQQQGVNDKYFYFNANDTTELINIVKTAINYGSTGL